MGTTRKRNSFTLSPSEAAQLDSLLRSAELERVPTSSLKTNPRNAKDHPENQIELIAENIRKLGQIQPIVCDEDFVILAGHARLAAIKRLGLESARVLRVKHLNETQKRVFALADNRLAELGSWNVEALRSELTVLTDAALECEFSTQIIGFDTALIDAILEGDVRAERPDPADAFEPPQNEAPPVTRLGDVWFCGRHSLLCADALAADAYTTLLQGDKANVVFTDPPWNVPNAGHVTRRTGVREFAMANGEMSSEEFGLFLSRIMHHIANNSQRGAITYVCIDWRHWAELQSAAAPNYGAPRSLIVWDKGVFGMGGTYRSQHEFIGVFVTPGAANKFKPSRIRARSNVWKYRGVNSSPDRAALLAMHPTVKPVALVADALRDCSEIGDVVLDPFAGSGTTMIAAQKTKRNARLIEIDPTYCDVIVRRWEQFSGESACLASGETFGDTVKTRSPRNEKEG